MGSLGAAILASVPKYLRSQAMAVAIFFIHFFGDFPSPLIIGWLIGIIGYKWAIFFTVMWGWWSPIFWIMASILVKHPTSSFLSAICSICKSVED